MSVGLRPTLMTRILIATCATKSYTYALPALLRAVQRNCYRFSRLEKEVEISFLLVGDKETCRQFDDSDLKRATGLQSSTYAGDWGEHPNYKPKAQAVIAQMRSVMFEEARRQGADFFWSLDSDVLPPDNALLCSHQMLAFDGGYYSIAACPYPSQGGGSFLTGRGDHRNAIFCNWEMEELDIPEDLKAQWKELSEGLAQEKEREKAEALFEKRQELRKKIEQECPPQHGGNIFKVTGEHGWKPRGWFDYCYPGIGRGSVVPVDWCGFGCTYCNRDAIATADFTGYQCGGTEDLFIIWNCWAPRGLRICSIPHCPCDHIIRQGEDRVIAHERAYHEPDGPMVGHLRRHRIPFYQHIEGEQIKETAPLEGEKEKPEGEA